MDAETYCRDGEVSKGALNRTAEVALFRALGDERRLRILDAVAGSPGICACKLLEMFDMSQSTLSHHMKLLCEAGLVACSRKGKWANYTLRAEGLEPVERYVEGMLGAVEE